MSSKQWQELVERSRYWVELFHSRGIELIGQGEYALAKEYFEASYRLTKLEGDVMKRADEERFDDATVRVMREIMDNPRKYMEQFFELRAKNDAAKGQ